MLRNLVTIFVAGVWTALMFPVACVAMLVTFNAGASIWVARRWWSPVLLLPGDVTLVVSGREHVDPKRPTIYACNHQSTCDSPVMLIALGIDVLRFFAKSQLKWVPFLGWYLQLAGHIFVDRSSNRAAFASLRKAAHQIRRGTSIVVFPEGTRSETGEIGEFKKGSFELAMEAGAAVCPVAIEGTGRAMPKNRWTITPHVEFRVKIGAPLWPADFPDRTALRDAVRAQVVRQHLEIGGRGSRPELAAARA